MKKRTSWPSSLPRKQGWRVVVDAFAVESRVATNSFRCRSLIDGEISVLPGDVLIKLKNFDEDSARALCARMTTVIERNATVPEPRVTRARARASAQRAPSAEISIVAASDFEGEGEDSDPFGLKRMLK